MLKRILLLLLSIVIVTGLVSCKANESLGISVLTDVKGIPDEAEDAADSSDKNDNGNENTENGSEDVSSEDIIINKSSKKIHLSTKCSYAGTIKESNKLIRSHSDLESYLENGYSICSNCNKNYQNDN